MENEKQSRPEPLILNKDEDLIKQGEEIYKEASVRNFRQNCPYADKIFIKLATPQDKTAGMSCNDCPPVIKNSCAYFKASNIA